MRTVWCVVGVVLLTAAGGAKAGQAGGFTGVWTAVKDAPATLPASPSAVFGGRFELRHSGNSLTVVRPVRDFSIATEYALDGREVRTRVPGGTCMGDSGFIAAASIEAGTITFRTVGSLLPGGRAPTPLSVAVKLRVVSADTLEVEGTMRAAGDPAPRQVATIYRRSHEAMPSPAPRPNVTVAPATLADVAWLSGTWSGTAGTSTVEERWTPAEGGAMLGTSRTLRNGAMVAFEFLCIAERAGGLVYIAMPGARTPATDFLLTALDAGSATFENPSHDFPRKIRYAKRADGGLEAVISGAANQRATTFVLKRQ